jgi:AraC family transcriptional regulator, regulatory protein of adaptative response / methylated-DNA-[protein]-cysteine methyltransferase
MLKVQSESSPMEELARFIETHHDEALTLESLAQEAGLSPHHLQRRFKAEIGVSPKEYQEACRLQKLKSGLREQQPVGYAAYDAGFGSLSRVYERLDSRMGMTPVQYRSQGKGLEISYAIAPTSLGEVLMAATDRGICSIQFGVDREQLEDQLRREFPRALIQEMSSRHREQFSLWMEQLRQYLDGQSPALDLPLDIQGTAFQIKVWKYLQTIPRGTVASYAEVAKSVGSPGAVRAVAGSCARNGVAIAIPCHRVIRGNGDLAGYRWGTERKRALLEMERKR